MPRPGPQLDFGGIIDATEQPEFERILSDLREITKSGLELEIFCGSDSPENQA
ncbi:MAG: hypothetical protein VB071_06450 [Lawsonibacter sp.]|nr:hypothetical protein [Lawsonibacter sp.]